MVKRKFDLVVLCDRKMSWKWSHLQHESSGILISDATVFGAELITRIVRFMRGVSNKSVCPNQKRNRVYCNDKYTELGVTRRNMFGRDYYNDIFARCKSVKKIKNHSR